MSFLFDPEQRAAFTSGIVGWLTEHRRDFDPPQEDDLLDVAPEEIASDIRRKAFGELGACLRLVGRCPSLCSDRELSELTRWWVQTGESRQIFFDLRRRTQLFPLRLVAQAVRTDLGYENLRVRQEMQDVFDQGFIDRNEISAWHKLDMKYYADALGLRHSYPSAAELFSQCSLRNFPALPHASNYDLYGLTHLVFSFSDFGGCSVEAQFGSDLPYILEYSGAALAMCLARRDWDLIAELLMTRIYLGVRQDPLDQEAARALCESQQLTGFVPGRSWEAGALEAPTSERHTEGLFFDIYHPTLLCLFLICSEEAAA